MELKLSAAELRAIEVQYSVHGVPRQKSAMFDRWLAQDVHASWSKLAAALDRMGENKVARAVREKYCGGAGGAATAATTSSGVVASSPSTAGSAAVQRKCTSSTEVVISDCPPPM